MMSLFSEPPKNFGYRRFHKTRYEDPTLPQDSFPIRRENTKKVKFLPKISNKTFGGLQYGSGQEYSEGRQLKERTSSEIMKLKRHQQEADEDIKAFRERKLKEKEESLLTKKKDLEMLQQQYPWGRQKGGGAAKVSKSGNLDARYGKVPDDSCLQDVDLHYPFGRSGGGAPIKTNSGRLVTAVAGDPDIRFQKQLRREVEQTLRYKDNSKANTPVKITRTPSEIERKEIERKKKELYSRKLDEQRAESQERRQTIENEANDVIAIMLSSNVKHQFNPWGRDLPKRDDSGMLVKRQRGINVMGVATDCSDKEWWWNSVGMRSSTKTQIADPKNDGYDPWGKPGGGAPLASKSGKIVTTCGNLKRKLLQDSELSSSSSPDNHGHGITVAEWLRTRNEPLQDCNGSHGRNFSDVTATKLDIRKGDVSDDNRSMYHSDLQEQVNLQQEKQDKEKKHRILEEKMHAERIQELWPLSNMSTQRQPKRMQKREYFDKLQQMAEEKQQQQKIEKKEKSQKENEHMVAFNKFWGRPGGGAPRIRSNYQLDASPRNYGILSTQMTHKAQHKFRR